MVRGIPRKPKSTGRATIGLVEYVDIRGTHGNRRVLAKIDTGASRTTVDTALAAEVGLGPVVDAVKIRAPMGNGMETRPLVEATIRLSERTYDIPVGIVDRGDMKYPAIVGMDILGQGDFLIDVTRKAVEEETGLDDY